MLSSNRSERLMFTGRRLFDLFVVIFSLFVVAAFIISACGQEKTVGIPLEGQWKMIRQDSPAFALKDYDDSSWHEILLPNKHLMPSETESVPKGINSYGPLVSDYKGFVWYRKKIEISHQPSEELILQIREIMNADRIYLNGKLIGETGRFPPDFKSGWAKLRSYKIPEGLLQKGSNTIAIQVYFNSEAWVLGPMELVDHKYGAGRAMLSGLLMNEGIESLSFVLIGIAVFFMFLYIMRRQETSALFFSLACITIADAVGLQFIENLYPDIELSSETIFKISQSGLVAFPAFLSLFFWHYSNGTISKKRVVLTLLVVVVGIILLCYSSERHTIYFWRNLYLIVIAYLVIEVSIMAAIAFFRGKLHGVEVFIGMIPLLVLSIHDFLVFSVKVIDSGVSLFIYGIPMLLAVMGWHIVRRFVTSLEELEVKTELLEKYSRDLENRNLLLEKLDRTKDEFLANTSHELRTPLTGIIGIAESLMDGIAGPLQNETVKNLSMIVTSGKRLSTLVDDILDFSKIKNSGIELSLKAVDINMSTDMVISLTKPLIGHKNIKLINSIPENFPLVKADSNRIQQILYNLIGNGIKFTETGSVEVSALRREYFAEISVSDTGIGIPEDKYSEIFKSFEQVDSSVSRKYGGTGLGLPITKMLVELHGGTIRVDSVTGKGSKFTFSIPVVQEDEGFETHSPKMNAMAAKSVSHEEVAGYLTHSILPCTTGGAKILVVDDEPVNLQVLFNHLSNAGYNVHTASNGSDALSLVWQIFPDLVILDIMMPGMSGYDVCSHIREKYSSYEIPVLMLTAKSQVDDLVAGFESGANDYLNKPFDKRELLSRVESLARLRNSVNEHNKLLVLEQELDIAMRIQKSILPVDIPQMPNLRMNAYYKPMRGVGGDLYDFLHDGNCGMGVIVSDVSGHGIPAAIISSMVKIAFSLHKEFVSIPLQMMDSLNRALLGKCERHFVTAGYAYIDFTGSKIYYVSAGHLPAIVLKKKEKKIVKLKPRGRVLGLFSDTEFNIDSIDLADGDRIVLITDGIIECRDKTSDMFGEERLDAAIIRDMNLDAKDFTAGLLDELSKWMGGHDFEDDVAIIVIDYVV